MDMFETMDPLLKTFWFVAIPTSLIFLIQTVMTFIGVDASDGLEADFDGDLSAGDAPFQLFSLRNLINFLLGFSWTGISFFTAVSSKPLLIVLSLLVGASFVYLFFLIIKKVQKLSENNSFQIASTLHKTAEVYLTIPEKRSGLGKIMISVNGSFHELQAMTDGDKLPTGSVVEVVKIENDKILIVKPI
jgi:membrane protein implicated in regulation of membrane protease activity